jgi:regulator of telomere elongation helicase 1
MASNVGKILEKVCTIDGGILTFFSSYSYMSTFFKTLKKNREYNSLEKYKPILSEPSNAKECDKVIENHKIKVEKGLGSHLFGVCRGKISEGLDFKDDIGRAVSVVGVPYPDLEGFKVVLKRKYFEKDSKQYNKWYY